MSLRRLPSGVLSRALVRQRLDVVCVVCGRDPEAQGRLQLSHLCCCACVCVCVWPGTLHALRTAFCHHACVQMCSCACLSIQSVAFSANCATRRLWHMVSASTTPGCQRETARSSRSFSWRPCASSLRWRSTSVVSVLIVTHSQHPRALGERGWSTCFEQSIPDHGAHAEPPNHEYAIANWPSESCGEPIAVARPVQVMLDTHPRFGLSGHG